MFYTQEQILELWKQNTNPIGLYIHSPFCTNNCTFCAYKGLNKFSIEELTEYYDNLYDNITLYLNNIDNSLIETVYFGGGTPNLIPSNILKKILNKISKITKHIAIELSPTDNLQNINILLDYNVELLQFGIQSFDYSILNKVKRKHIDFDTFYDICNNIKDKIHVGIDLLGNLTKQDSWNRLKNDIDLARKLPIDFICISNNYYIKSELNNKLLIEYLNHLNIKIEDPFARSFIIKNNTYDISLYRKYFYCFENNNKSSNNILGIGAYKNIKHPTMSVLYIDNKRFDIEQCDFNKFRIYQRNNILLDRTIVKSDIQTIPVKTLLKSIKYD